MAVGWLKLYRKITEHKLWLEKRTFSRLEGWLYLLCSANFADRDVVLDGWQIKVRRGQVLTSEVKMAELFGWSRNRVRRFLEMLIDDGSITKDVTPKYTLITLVNYDVYQDCDTPDGTTDGATGGTPDGASNSTAKGASDGTHYKKERTKKEKEPKEEKKIIYDHPYVTMTETQFQTLLARYGEERLRYWVNRLGDYKASKGKKYQSDYHTILNWERMDDGKNRTDPKPQPTDPGPDETSGNDGDFFDLRPWRGVVDQRKGRS